MSENTVIRICRSLTELFQKSYNAYVAYREQEAEWNRSYGTDRHKQDKESVYERSKNQPKRTAGYQQQRTVKCKDRGAR